MLANATNEAIAVNMAEVNKAVKAYVANKAESNEADVTIMPAKANEANTEANDANKVILIGKAIVANNTGKAIKAANEADVANEPSKAKVDGANGADNAEATEADEACVTKKAAAASEAGYFGINNQLGLNVVVEELDKLVMKRQD
jgi:hypothetical protein